MWIGGCAVDVDYTIDKYDPDSDDCESVASDEEPEKDLLFR